MDPVTWKGRTAVVDTPADLSGPQCVICGASDDVHVVVKRYRGAPLTALFRSTEHVEMSLCQSCEDRWTTSQEFYRALFVLGLPGFSILGGLIGDSLHVEYAALFGTIAGFFVWLALLYASRLLFVLPRQVRCLHLEDGELLLRFPDPELTKRVLRSD